MWFLLVLHQVHAQSYASVCWTFLDNVNVTELRHRMSNDSSIGYYKIVQGTDLISSAWVRSSGTGKSIYDSSNSGVPGSTCGVKDSSLFTYYPSIVNGTNFSEGYLCYESSKLDEVPLEPTALSCHDSRTPGAAKDCGPSITPTSFTMCRTMMFTGPDGACGYSNLTRQQGCIYFEFYVLALVALILLCVCCCCCIAEDDKKKPKPKPKATASTSSRVVTTPTGTVATATSTSTSTTTSASSASAPATANTVQQNNSRLLNILGGGASSTSS